MAGPVVEVSVADPVAAADNVRFLTIVLRFLEEQNMKYRIRLKDTAMRFIVKISFITLILAIFVQAEAASVQAKPKSYTSADEAVQSLIAAIKTNDDKALLSIFGEEGKDIISSGDPVADQQGRKRFLTKYEEKSRLLAGKDSMNLLLGNDEWPFPIPVVKRGSTWFFDTAKGKEEILNRRIGENELSTIETCLAIVDAQREYAMMDIDGDGVPEYAEKLMSDPGKKNGLYWESKEGEAPSPIGPVLAEARKEGYSGKNATGSGLPYHGYYYRALKAQGKNAEGGAYEYVIRGKMIGGFALVAYPAIYGNSGVMTFIVNHDGIVYQKNLGKDTAKYADAMKQFDPDKTWKKVEAASK